MTAADGVSRQALTTFDVVRYGAPGTALALLGIPLFMLVPPFFVDTLRLDAAAVGLALLCARVLDLAIDPLAGHACRTAARARVMLLLGAAALAGGAAMLFLPPLSAGTGWLFIGALVAYAGWSLVQVPLFALGASLPDDDRDRARLAVSREGWVIAGTLLALAIPVLAGVVDDLRRSLALLWGVLAVALPVSLLLLWPLPARARWGGVQDWSELGARSVALFRRRDFRGLLLAYFINALANGIPATLLVLYVMHVLEARASLGLLLGSYLLAGLLALPAWLWLARRIGAAAAWLWSMAWAALVFALVPLLGAGDVGWFLAICIGAGTSLGADNALPSALQAGVAARLRHGDGAAGEDAGLVFGWWGLATKLALAGGAALGLGAIDLGGFTAAAVTDAGRSALALAYSLLPVLFKLLACVLVWRALRTARAGGETWVAAAS